MKTSLLPKTNGGRVTVGLTGIAIFLFLCRVLVKSFLVELYLSSIDVPGFLATTSITLIWFLHSTAFIVGIFAIKCPRENSFIVNLSTVFGFLIFVYGVINFFVII